MKGYIPVEIPTKRYIKAYLCANLGEKPIMTSDHKIGNKFYDLLHNKRNERKSEFSNKRYNAKVRLFVNYHTFTHRGANLHETNIKNFNLFVEKEVKEKFYDLMDFYIEVLPSFEANLPLVRKKLGIILDDDWSDDSMKKDYYRHRLEKGLPLLYNKTSARTVPSGNISDIAF
ncbi:MAG TPA: hypothetical protein VEB42_03645 [Chitinophagaceae bacterium]|nr:hypothetical protein [Chitinophagaceae bacterium]